MKRVVFLIILVLLILIAFHLLSKEKAGKKISKEYSIPEAQFIPQLSYDDTLLVKSGFVIAFSKKNKIPNWAAYMLSKDEVQHAIAKRADRFISEKKICTATDLDYRKSGFDKGHIVPAKDMAYSEKCMNESFYYSNVCPQEPVFNRGRWKQLEEKVRDWAVSNDSVFIITGVFSHSFQKTIGPNKIPVPDYFYKAIVDITEPEIKAIAFLFQNQKISEPLEKFAISIDSLESFTKIDFLPEMPDELEFKLEAKFDSKLWNF